MSEGKVAIRNISMYPNQWAAVDAFAKDMGLSRSSAMRMIVDQWLRFQKITAETLKGDGKQLTPTEAFRVAFPVRS